MIGFAKHILNYSVSTFGSKVIGLISIPILTRLLKPDDYGIINIIGSYAIIISVLFTFNLQSSIVRYYHENKKLIGGFLFQIVTIQSFIVAMLHIFISFNKNYVSSSLSLPIESVSFLAPIAYGFLIENWIKNYFKAFGGSNVIRNYTLLRTYIGFFLALIIIYSLNEDKYLGKIYAELFMVVFSLLFFLKYFFKIVQIKYDSHQLKYMFSYSLGLAPAYLGGILLSQIDRVMIGNYVDNYAAGLYSFAYALATLQTVFADIFNNSWLPKYYRYMNEKEYKSHDKDVLIILRIFTLSCCFLMLFGAYIGKILSSKEFHNATELIPLIAIGTFFQSATTIYQRHISFSKKTIWTSLVIIFSATFNVILNVIYIPKYGMYAAAATTLLSYILRFILTYFVVRYVIKSHYTSMMAVIKVIYPILIGIFISIYNPQQHFFISLFSFITIFILLFKNIILSIIARQK